MTLTKSQIIEANSEANGFTKRKATKTVETVLEIIEETLESGDDILISGFGKFQVKQKAERNGRNPATDDPGSKEGRHFQVFWETEGAG